MFKPLAIIPFNPNIPVPVQKYFRILILDDSGFDRLRIKREISKAGMNSEIDEISCLCQLENALNNERYDLVVIDYFLPDGTGEDAINVVLNHGINKSAKMLLVSGNPWVNEGLMKEESKRFYFLRKDKLGYGEILREIIAADDGD